MFERVKDLNWPLHLFHDYTVAVNGTQIGHKPKIGDDKCVCGKIHKNNVSRVVTTDRPFGYSRSVVWYCSWECKNKDIEP
jgi:hypothetical protein